MKLEGAIAVLCHLVLGPKCIVHQNGAAFHMSDKRFKVRTNVSPVLTFGQEDGDWIARPITEVLFTSLLD